MRRLALAIVLVVACPMGASAQATLITGLGGPLDFGPHSLARGDDTSSATIDLTPIFPTGFFFFARHYTSVFVNTNGNVSFGAPLDRFTPTPFPFPACSVPMVAPWWADVDTRAALTTDINQNEVYYAVDTTNQRFVVTWTHVSYYYEHADLSNSFQLVLTPATDGRTFDVEMRYAECQWTTGDASGGMHGLGGTPAQAGFDAADGVDFLQLPGSRTMSVLDLCTTSNVGMPGVWQLHGVVTPMCGNGLRETGEACDDGADHTRCDASCQIVVPVDAGSDAAIDVGTDDVGPDDAATDDAGTDAAAFDAGLDMGPCAPPPDMGVRRTDAGTRFDAGQITPMDGGRRDTGPPPPITYDVTGGGCGCRAGGRGSRSALLVLVVAWLVAHRVRVRGRGRVRARVRVRVRVRAPTRTPAPTPSRADTTRRP